MTTYKQPPKSSLSARGKLNGRVKLTAEQVDEMRRIHDRASKETNVKALAERYGVTPRAIYLILSGKRWVSKASTTSDDAALPATHNALALVPAASAD